MTVDPEQQDLDRPPVRGRHDQVRDRVTIEITCVDVERTGPDRDLLHRAESCAIAAIQKNRNRIPTRVGSGQVRPAVAIEVRSHRVARTGSGWMDRGREVERLGVCDRGDKCEENRGQQYR
jgi:hypothetical protein